MSRIGPPDAPAEKPTGLPSNRLAELRIAAGMRRLDVAAHVDRDPQTLYRWERGETQIPDSAKHQLADLFGVSIPWLMGWDSQQETAA